MADNQDALSLLRKSIAVDNAPTPSTSEDPSTQADLDISLADATYLVFNFTQAEDGGHHIALPISQKTRFESKAASKAVDLRSVYFTWQNREQQTIRYINAVAAINEELKKAGKDEVVTSLSFQERTDLVNWLNGDIAENACEFIRSLDDNKATRKEADDAAALVAGGDEDIEMRDAGLSDAAARKKEEELLRAIYASERKMGDRNTILRGSKLQDYSGVRKRCADVFLKGRSAAQPTPTPAAPTLTNNPALRPPVKAPQPGRRPEPIILLSPSASSLLRMPNIKSFLVDGIYQPPDNTASSGANILHLTRKLSDDISKHPVRFILVDSPEHFRHDYWERVVAVFTTGQTWQFKNYKWQNPADLFANALGVYVGWKGEVVPETVKGWGRGVLTLQVDKGKDRWRDREVVEDIWRAIEGRMRGKGWGGK
ncbi:accessory factor associated with RNA polymerase II [Saxophila tyrrhenica]|uniref:Accessory factor associated with RNA polymerase II n=1 Tax=Saxophila tyrrhenica TaxID=1690608 RepID=A0AAV9P6Q0_9PEZI|nr:accessory factor associated with RNA polymerase II [Saxophila tyrrhenica]